jgi:hypothetical protein
MCGRYKIERAGNEALSPKNKETIWKRTRGT